MWAISFNQIFCFVAVMANIILLEERWRKQAIEWKAIWIRRMKGMNTKGLIAFTVYILYRSTGNNHSLKMYAFHINSMISFKANGLAGFQNFSAIRSLIRRDTNVDLHYEFIMVLYQFNSLG